MKALLRAVTLIVLMIMLVNPVMGKSVDAVKQFYEQMFESAKHQPAGSVSFLDYEMTLKERDGSEYVMNVSHNKVYRKGSRMYIASEKVDFWKTEQDAVVVMHSNKTIHWAKVVATEESQGQVSNFDKILEFQRELFLNPFNVVEKPLANNQVQVLLTPRNAITEAYNVSIVEFIYDYTTNKVVRMTMFYVPAHKYVYQEVKYLAVDFSMKTKILKGDLIHKVISDNGTAAGKYKGYAVVKMFDEAAAPSK